ncbi:MAG: MBL fold metallo-hydrolase, partial [Longimicrobiales bacterium]
LDHCATPPPAEPDRSYALAAIREVFEETGVLLASPPALPDESLAQWRESLLADRVTLLDVVRATGRRLDPGALVYIAHWITPAPEPRRYDTRFFLVPLPAGCTASADAREMTDARWLRPQDALDSFHAGRLPMVFPTVRTLEQLSGFTSVDAVLEEFRGRRVATVEPRLVRTRDGVGIVID